MVFYEAVYRSLNGKVTRRVFWSWQCFVEFVDMLFSYTWNMDGWSFGVVET